MGACDRLLGCLAGRARRHLLLAFALGAAIATGGTIVVADPASPITITDVDTPDPVASGGPLTHTITVVNTGGSKITNVVLTDQLNGVAGMGVPPQLQLASSRGSCVQSGDLVTCAAGTIEGNGTWTVSIRGIVTAPNGTVLNNTVAVTGTHAAQNFTTTHTETTLVGSGGGSALPDLTIDKTGPTSVAVLSTMTYTLTVNNIGGQNATDIVVVDTVPAELSNISAVGTSLFTCNVVGQTVTCSGGAVNAGSNATISIQVDAPATIPDPNTITNTAVVDPENSIAEGNELNNTSALVNTAIVATVPTPPLSISVEDSADPVIPGQGVTYTLFVVNNAPIRADDVSIVMGTQGLEAASVIVSQTVVDGTVGNSGGCANTASEAKCLVRMLNPGGTITMLVQGFVIGAAGSGIIATGTVTGNIRNDGVSSTDTELTTIKPFIDLTITKADAPDPVCARSWPAPVPPAPVPPFPGPVCLGGLTYTYVVGNSGMGTATNVVVRDPLPPGTIFDHATPAICSVDPATNVLTCTIASLPPGITTFTVVLVAPPGVGTLANTATVDPFNAIFEGDETNNMATATTLVSTGIDLVIDKTDEAPGFDPIATSGTQTYTIRIDNIGPQDATNIRVRDTLPSGTIFRDVTMQTNGFTCSHSAGTLECIGGSIRGTESEFYGPAPLGPDMATIKFRLFAQSFEGTMHNEVRVDPLNEIPEINEANNFEFEDTVVQRGGAGTGAFNDLTIDKQQASPADPVARNALVTFEITVGNDGTDPVTNVLVRDFLPAGARFREAFGTNNFHCTESNNIVNCSGGNIGPAASALITVKMFAPDPPGTYTNQAIADPDDTIPEGNEFNNQDSENIVVQNDGNGAFNDLSITKDDSPDPVRPKKTLTYTLTVSNDGTDPALDVTVRDVLPEGVTFVSADDAAPALPGAFTCSESALTVTCTGGTIGGGGGVRAIQILVKAPNATGVTLTNQAIVDPENEIPEGDELNNTDEEETTVASDINLSITKTGPHTSSQSQVTDYKLTIENHAPSGETGQTAFGVDVHDPLPVGVIPLAVDTGSNNNFACQVAEDPINVVDCTGDLNPGSPVTITITVFMTAESSRSLDNEACIDPNDEIAEFAPPGETDNCSTHSTPVGPPPKRSPDLLVSKSVSQAQASPGDTLTYTITVSNIGDAKHKGALTITDNLPNQTTAVGIVGPNLWTCSGPADIMTCNIPASPNDEIEPGGSVQFTVTATVNPTASQPLVNAASATGGLADPAETDAENEPAAKLGNNTATAKTTVGSANIDLSIGAITDNPDPVFPGTPVKYTIVALNGGGTDINNALVRITMPSAGSTFVAADGTNGFNCAAPVGTLIDCTGNLPAGGDTVITVTLFVLLAPPGDLTLSAVIDPNNAVAEDHEDNNSDSEVTTVSGTVCVGCVDLVSALLVASPEPVPTGGSVTFKYVLINAGDQPTSYTSGQPLAFFDVFGTHTSFSIATSDPSLFTCTTLNPLSTTSKLNDCFGNLGPGQGVTITATMGGVSGSDVTAIGRADPASLILEVNETNNNLTETVVIFP